MTSVEEILKKRNIEPKQSHFLITHQSKSGKEDFFDPKDQYGLKLSSDWHTAKDSYWTVGLRKLKNNLKALFNPDTYVVSSIEKLKHWLLINQTVVVLTAFVVTIPSLLFVINIIPVMRKAKTQYVLHQYLRRRYFEEEFRLGHRKISRREVESILKDSHTKLNV